MALPCNDEFQELLAIQFSIYDHVWSGQFGQESDTQSQHRTYISINPEKAIYYLVRNRSSIPADGLICMADQEGGNNFGQYFEYPGTSLPRDFEFYQGFLEIAMYK